jgi:hypothetical protein
VTAAVKHMTRNKPGTAGAAVPARPRNSQLRERFPPRPAQPWWPATAQGEQETLRRLTLPPFLPVVKATRAGRRRGPAKLLRWLSSFPGDTWQQRWKASGAEDRPGSSWLQLPLDWLRDNGLAASYDANDLSSGLLMLICGDVIRPALAWMVTRAHKHLAPVMEAVRDPGGFARLRELAESGPPSSLKDARLAATRIATLLACKGGIIGDITVGDCVEMADVQRLVHSRGGQKKVDFYLRLHALGVFPASAPATIRAFGMAQGQLTIGELVDRYRLQCTPVRDLIVDYLRERQPALDYASLDAVSSSLAGRFWARIEALSPGISTLRLPPEVARAWKEDLQTVKRTVTSAGGEQTVISSPRLNAKDELLRVRAFYLDIAQWATEEPARWAQWAVPSPVSDTEISRARDLRRRKARMDARTRERLPVLPVLTRTAADRKISAARPSEEYRTPADEEWDAFLAHFEKRKVSVGTCARAFATPCVHEHACVRCSLLRPEPAQRGRLEEIRANLHDRIAEAEREGWPGEAEGLKVSLAGTEDKLAQIDAALRRQAEAVQLGMPAFPDIVPHSLPTDR